MTEIRAVAPPAGTAVSVGGTTAGLVDELASLGATLPWMALLVCLSTFVLLFLAFGSVVLPAKAIVMVRVLLVPATMRLPGRASWRAPRPLRRLYARYGIRADTPGPAPVAAGSKT